jgi:transcriptional regulator with XRE-family HTH domain
MAHLYDVSKIPDEDKIDREFGAVLRQLRVQAGFSIHDVHTLTKIQESRLMSLESGHGCPSILPRELNRLASIYQVDPEELMPLLA